MLNAAAALGLTLAIEAPIVWAALAGTRCDGRLRVAAALLPSALTHPFAWRAMGNFGAHDYLFGWLLIESLVVLVETLLLRWLTRLSLRFSLGLSLGANAASAVLGWSLS